MARNVIATVSQAALRHNVNQIRQRAPHSKIMAMVKANAYGHGLSIVASTLQDVDALGVACIDEALLIRQIGVQTDIVLMEGIFKEEELPLVQAYRFTQVVHHWPQIQALRDYANTVVAPFKVWLKVNTGMNRLGFSAEEFDEAYRVLTSLPNVQLLGIMTHFSHADDKSAEFTALQMKQFKEIIGERPGECCLANSAAILSLPTTHANWVRPGLMLYGASPFNEGTGADFNLLPAMTLQSEIIAIRQVKKGEKVGYSGTWESARDNATIGIVAMGYGDGYPWHAKSGTPVLVNKQRVPTVGRVSMDMLAVDLSAIGPVKLGAPVTLWGEGLAIEEIARQAGTIPYELFCRFTERVTVKVIS